MRFKTYRTLPRFMGGMECSIYDIDRHLKYHDFGEAHHLAPAQKPIGKQWKLRFPDPEPGNPFEVPPQDPEGSLWRQRILYLVERRHYFKFWAVFAMEYSEDTKSYKVLQCQLDAQEHRWLLEHAGDLFLGYELGEMDGLYQRDALPFADPPPSTRREAYQHWWDYQQQLKAKLHDYVVATCALTFPHYYAEMGARMLGQEMGQGLLNHQLAGAYLRGACKQYDLDFGVVVSGFDRWGAREYMREGMVAAHGSGPYVGHSVDFQVRTWHLCWLYGSSFVFPELGHYADEVQNGVRQLSPLGKAYEEFCHWAHDPGPLPEIHCPIAIVLDHYSGWMPPHQLYSGQTHRVWGNLPYDKGDYAIHALLDLFYPGYDQASLYRDERGFMVSTPFGDCVDVLLANTKLEALEGYPVALLWGCTDIDEAQADTLARYVESGNALVLSCADLSPALSERLKIVAGEEEHRATHSHWTATGYEFREEAYRYREPLGKGRKVLATSEEGICTMAEFPRGNGRLICLGQEYGATDRLQVPVAGELDPPYELLNVVKHLLSELAEAHAVLQIEGRPIHWVTNGDGSPGTLLGLFNHTDWNWQGTAKSNRPYAELRDRLSHQRFPASQDHCQLDVPARGFRVLEVT